MTLPRGAFVCMGMSNQAILTQEASSEMAVRCNPPRNMSIPEAAAYLGISVRKLRYDISEGRIRAVRFGRRVILRLKDLDEVLEQNAY